MGYQLLSKAPVGATAKFVDLRSVNGCILTDKGLPLCWGSDDLGAITPQPQTTYTSLYTDEATVCAISRPRYGRLLVQQNEECRLATGFWATRR